MRLGRQPRHRARMANVIIRCPRTCINVQIWLAKNPATDQANDYEAVTCPACLHTHFVNKTTGRLLGEKEK